MAHSSLRDTYVEILCDYAYGLRAIIGPGDHKLIPGAPSLYAAKRLVGDGVEVFNSRRQRKRLRTGQWHERIITSDRNGRTRSTFTQQDPVANLSTREILTSIILLSRIIGSNGSTDVSHYADIELGSPEFEAVLVMEELS
jgi:hypothetical protein